MSGLFSLKFEEFLIANPSSVNASLRTTRIDVKTPRAGAFFKALYLSVYKNAFIGSTKITQRRAISLSIQFLALAACF